MKGLGLHEVNAVSVDDVELTENEKAWVAFLRLVSDGSDPGVRLRDVQLLRRLLRRMN